MTVAMRCRTQRRLVGSVLALALALVAAYASPAPPTPTLTPAATTTLAPSPSSPLPSEALPTPAATMSSPSASPQPSATPPPVEAITMPTGAVRTLPIGTLALQGGQAFTLVDNGDLNPAIRMINVATGTGTTLATRPLGHYLSGARITQRGHDEAQPSAAARSAPP
jgi:hypothetical protein